VIHSISFLFAACRSVLTTSGSVKKTCEEGYLRIECRCLNTVEDRVLMRTMSPSPEPEFRPIIPVGRMEFYMEENGRLLGEEPWEVVDKETAQQWQAPRPHKVQLRRKGDHCKPSPDCRALSSRSCQCRWSRTFFVPWLDNTHWMILAKGLVPGHLREEMRPELYQCSAREHGWGPQQADSFRRIQSWV
jgi:hypothetical protein